MGKKNNQLIMRVPDPFDGSARTRLINMGLLDRSGEVNRESMQVFVDIFSGLFFDDLYDFFDEAKDLFAIFKTFTELYAREDYNHMYLLISIQYDYIRKPLPDPVWWLAGNTAAVKEFMTLFMERYKRLIGSTIIVQEIRCPDEYILDTTAQTIKIKGNTTHSLTFYNTPKSGLQIIKIDSETKQPLKDAKFTVYKKNGEVLGDYETDKDGLIILDKLDPGWITRTASLRRENTTSGNWNPPRAMKRTRSSRRSL